MCVGFGKKIIAKKDYSWWFEVVVVPSFICSWSKSHNLENEFLCPSKNTGTPRLSNFPTALYYSWQGQFDALRYVLPPIKNWWPFCSAKLYIKMLGFQRKLIDTITNSNFYLGVKENNGNYMAAQVFWDVFFPANDWAKSVQHLILTVLPFHPHSNDSRPRSCLHQVNIALFLWKVSVHCLRAQSAEWSTSSLLPPLPKRDQIQDFVGHEMLMLDIPSAHKLLLAR